ncbi:hypothetical protein BDD12DRAFT_903668 [Trichophaea hybrida]|nr:hypothetical protein BDD12DRAFT_903668 [Trichophaea hybrida]
MYTVGYAPGPPAENQGSRHRRPTCLGVENYEQWKSEVQSLTRIPDMFKGPEESGQPKAEELETEDDDEIEIVSGKIDDQSNEDFLSFPGRLNDHSIKPLIDTGGGCNLIKAEWLKEHGFTVDGNSERTQTLLMADGSTSKECPCFLAKWMFDGRKKAWVDVEFVIVEGYKYEALIGLSFLKHTETIHNS